MSSSSKKPMFTPKMASKISVPILSNVVPAISALGVAVSEMVKPLTSSQATEVNSATSALSSAIAVSSMPAKKRPLLNTGTATTSTATDAAASQQRDSTVASSSSDSDDDIDLLIAAPKLGKRKLPAKATNVKKVATGDDSVVIIPSASSHPSSFLDKYDKRLTSDTKTRSNSNSSGSSSANVVPAFKEKRTRVRKPKPTHDIFPSSMEKPRDIVRLTKYFRKEANGIVGITFKNVDGRPVVDTIDRSLYPETHNNNGSLPHHIQSGDVMLSVNSLDSRFTTYDKMMAELVLKNSNKAGADDRTSIKNSVSDAMAVVVFARPIY